MPSGCRTRWIGWITSLWSEAGTPSRLVLRRADTRRVTTVFFICVAPLGSFTASGQWTGNRGWTGIYPQSPGNAYADFLLGYVDSSSYASPNYQRFYGREWDFYVQDTFKASPRLTLNFGVRYLYERPWTFKDHNATFWDPATNKLVIQENSSTVTVPPGADPGAFTAYPFETTQQIGAPL